MYAVKIIIFVLLLVAQLATAADRRYVVCLVSGSIEQCTKPLTKEAADAVFEVFTSTPIAGLDWVYLADTKAKKKPTRGDHPLGPKLDKPEVQL